MFSHLNKQGAERMLSPYWFLILVLVATGIYLMATNFYGHPYDVRALESEILANQVVDCISDKGELSEDVFGEVFAESFPGNCDLILDDEYYVLLKFIRVEDLNNVYDSVFAGNQALVSYCAPQAKKAQEKLPSCFEKRFYLLENDQQYVVEILTIVDKGNENVK